MPTDKPRVTFAISEEKLAALESYRYDNKIKNQSQAILSLIDKGLSSLESGKAQKNSPSAAEAAPGEAVSDIFDKLNDLLVSTGLIKDGDDLTAQQAEVILAVCRIINATFQN